MTNEELDILWFKAMRQSAEGDKALGHYCFAALVAAAEREACAEICRAYAMPDGTSITAMVLEKAIRARREG